MDEKFVQGLVGGVLNRHKDKNLDENRIQTLMVEIAANLESFSGSMKKQKDIEEQNRNYNFIMEEMSEGEREHLRAWTRGKAKDNPLSIEMWKGYGFKSKKDEEEYLKYWTCDICGKHTHEVDYDYLGNGTNHLGCELKQEELQAKSDKIMKQVEEDMKDFKLYNSVSNENSYDYVDMKEAKRKSQEDKE